MIRFERLPKNKYFVGLNGYPGGEYMRVQLMQYRETINTLNRRVIAAAKWKGRYYKLAFADPFNQADIVKVESLIGMQLPPELCALLLAGGAFAHVDYAQVWQTIRTNTMAHQLDRLARRQDPAYANDHELGLVAAIHEAWGGREEFYNSLAPDIEEMVNRNYFVFGCRYVHDNVHDYLYFDRNGLFGNFLFDQDDARYNLRRIEALAEILPDAGLAADECRIHTQEEAAAYGYHDTFPGLSLEQLLHSQFEAVANSLAENADEDEEDED